MKIIIAAAAAQRRDRPVQRKRAMNWNQPLTPRHVVVGFFLVALFPLSLVYFISPRAFSFLFMLALMAFALKVVG